MTKSFCKALATEIVTHVQSGKKVRITGAISKTNPYICLAPMSRNAAKAANKYYYGFTNRDFKKLITAIKKIDPDIKIEPANFIWKLWNDVDVYKESTLQNIKK